MTKYFDRMVSRSEFRSKGKKDSPLSKALERKKGKYGPVNTREQLKKAALKQLKAGDI